MDPKRRRTDVSIIDGPENVRIVDNEVRMTYIKDEEMLSKNENLAGSGGQTRLSS